MIEHDLNNIAIRLEVEKYEIFRGLPPPDNSPASPHIRISSLQILLRHLPVLTLYLLDHMR